MLKIWGRTTSSNVQKVLWCCAELGVEYDRVDFGGPFGGNQDPEYLALNPNGLVPTVKDGELILWESNSICRYRSTIAALPTKSGEPSPHIQACGEPCITSPSNGTGRNGSSSWASICRSQAWSPGPAGMRFAR